MSSIHHVGVAVSTAVSAAATIRHMQIVRVRTPNRLNLVVYVQHSRGIIRSDADLYTHKEEQGALL